MTWNAKKLCKVMKKLRNNGAITLTANDVWRAIGHEAELETPNGTMGAAFNRARSKGLIRSTPNFTRSTHPARRRGVIRVWEFM